MATKLNKPVRRELQATCATKKGRMCKPHEMGSRPVIVELGTDEMLRFRVKGTRKEFELHLIVAMQIAQVNQIQEDYRNKMTLYQQKKKAGYRNVRKPKKPFYPSVLLR